MASSNVEFYQRQKEMQDKVTKCEQERIQLEKQLRLLMQSDQNSAQLKAAKLQTYWRKLCADEKRAQQRNAMLVREFERIDTHLSSMAARTERLNLLKRQYADYVARTYPQWTQMVEQKMRGEVSETPAAQASTRHPEAPNLRHSQDWAEAEKEDTAQQQQQQQHHQQQQQQQYRQQQQQHQAPVLSRESSTGEDSTTGKAPTSQPVQNVSIQRVSASVNRTAPSSSAGNASAVRATGQQAVSSVANISAVRTTGQQQYQQLKMQQQQQHSAKPAQSAVTAADNAGGDQKSDYVNIASFSSQQAPLAHVGQGDQGPMAPGGDDEDVSDFGSDLPLSAGDASPVKVPQADKGPSKQKAFAQARSDSVRSSGSLLPELTVDGLILLLRHIEAHLGENGSGEQVYVSPILDPEQKLDIIQRANSSASLHGISGLTASNLVLEQMSHVVRNLPEGCLIADTLLTKPHSHLTVADIACSLAGDAQDLWTVIFQHFQRLLAAKVMEPREIAAVFVPCLVADRSQFQDKAFSLVVNLLEGEETDATDASSIASPRPPASPTALGGSNSLMEDGKVPPLKFGSLVDKPFSDDESSFFDQSMPKEPAVPLNETSAYKQMLSGTLAKQRAPIMSDTDDDDVEKVLASSLTPKGNSARGMPAATPREAATDPESISEAPVAGAKSPVYVPTAMEHKPMFGTGGSSQGSRRPGLKLGSDFETDSEMDTGIIGSSKKRAEEDKDDFDFYD